MWLPTSTTAQITNGWSLFRFSNEKIEKNLPLCLLSCENWSSFRNTWTLLTLSLYLDKWDHAETMTRTTITIFLTLQEVYFLRLVIVVNHYKEEYIFFSTFFSFSNKQKKERPICLVKGPGFAEGTVILARSVPTCFSQKAHSKPLNLSVVSTVGFNMRSSISINGCHKHINHLAVNNRADPIGDTC